MIRSLARERGGRRQGQFDTAYPSSSPSPPAPSWPCWSPGRLPQSHRSASSRCSPLSGPASSAAADAALRVRECDAVPKNVRNNKLVM